MISTENQIWDKITDSAKEKFDYTSFAKDFPFDPDDIEVIFKIIIGYAAAKQKEVIISELFSDMLLLGYTWDKPELTQFVEDKKELFKLEIYVSKLAAEMLNDNVDPMAVYNTVCQLLSDE